MSGKGDTPRHNLTRYGEGWDRIWGVGDSHRQDIKENAESALNGGTPNKNLWGRLVRLTCENCGKDFMRRKAEAKRNAKMGRGVFCSISCNTQKQHKNGKHKDREFKFQQIGTIASRDARIDEYSPFRNYLRKTKNTSRKNRENNLTLQYLKQLWDEQQGRCAISGIPMRIVDCTSDSLMGNPYQASIDRIDNNLGYIQGNVRWVVYIANICRNNFSDGDVLRFAEDLVQNLSVGGDGKSSDGLDWASPGRHHDGGSTPPTSTNLAGTGDTPRPASKKRKTGRQV